MERMLEKTDYRIDALKHNEISNPFIRNLLTGDKNWYQRSLLDMPVILLNHSSFFLKTPGFLLQKMLQIYYPSFWRQSLFENVKEQIEQLSNEIFNDKFWAKLSQFLYKFEVKIKIWGETIENKEYFNLSSQYHSLLKMIKVLYHFLEFCLQKKEFSSYLPLLGFFSTLVLTFFIDLIHHSSLYGFSELKVQKTLQSFFLREKGVIEIFQIQKDLFLDALKASLHASIKKERNVVYNSLIYEYSYYMRFAFACIPFWEKKAKFPFFKEYIPLDISIPTPIIGYFDKDLDHYIDIFNESLNLPIQKEKDLSIVKLALITSIERETLHGFMVKYNNHKISYDGLQKFIKKKNLTLLTKEFSYQNALILAHIKQEDENISISFLDQESLSVGSHLNEIDWEIGSADGFFKIVKITTSFEKNPQTYEEYLQGITFTLGYNNALDQQYSINDLLDDIDRTTFN